MTISLFVAFSIIGRKTSIAPTPGKPVVSINPIYFAIKGISNNPMNSLITLWVKDIALISAEYSDNMTGAKVYQPNPELIAMASLAVIGKNKEPSAAKAVVPKITACLLYTSDAADEEDSVDLGGRRIIKK